MSEDPKRVKCSIMSSFWRKYIILYFSDDLYSYRRGDIPIFNFDEADRILIQTLQELIEALRKLKAEVNIQKQETMLLAKALQECKACRIKRPECSDDPPPCFPKVECR